MELSDCINFMLTRAQNSVFNYFKAQLATLDVTPVQYAVLKCLWDNGDQYPTQIAAAICLDTSTVTGILDRMEKKGLLERVHSATDRRAVSIRIKPAGAALQKDVEAVISAANHEVLAGLDGARYTALRGELDKIVANCEEGALAKKRGS